MRPEVQFIGKSFLFQLCSIRLNICPNFASGEEGKHKLRPNVEKGSGAQCQPGEAGALGPQPRSTEAGGRAPIGPAARVRLPPVSGRMPRAHPAAASGVQNRCPLAGAAG